MRWHWDGHHWGWMVLWWLFVLVVIAVIIWVVVVLVRRSSAKKAQDKETPEQQLKNRYARGEIDRETYEQMLDDLRR